MSRLPIQTRAFNWGFDKKIKIKHMKRFIINNKIVFLFCFAFLFSACDYWLDVAPEKDLIKDNFWKKTDDANSALAATYSCFRSGAIESLIWGEVRADMIMGFPNEYASIAGSDISATNKMVNWSTYYKTINLANTLMYYNNEVLKNDLSFTPKMKNGMDAEALFLRSLSYFYLVRVWKNVPLITSPSIADTSNFYPPISSEAEILKQVTSDLLKAKDLAYTTEFKSNPRYFVGRANKYSIMTLLADVYLWNQQYQKCIDYCDSVINSGLYALEPITTFFNIYNPGNSRESIFDLQFVDDGTEDQINPLFKSKENSAWVTFINLGNKRTVLSLNYNYSNVFQGVVDARSFNGKGPFFKYTNIALNNDLWRSPSGQRDPNISYYRYSDILLMKAEALNELGRIDEARSFVAPTAERGNPLIELFNVTDQNEMRKLILDERAREFVFEGKRWFDILRYGKRKNFQNKQVIAQILINNAESKSLDVLRSKVNDTMMYYLPIPYDEMKRNKNLKQNPFYER